ncbi:hypothetical protein DFS34DRAFT_648834 [Phlyctochytrium arcticum]|nr:hypothetical protein DFS34DRAFT_648834 [Phlyctochytrium arcticum]
MAPPRGHRVILAQVAGSFLVAEVARSATAALSCLVAAQINDFFPLGVVSRAIRWAKFTNETAKRRGWACGKAINTDDDLDLVLEKISYSRASQHSSFALPSISTDEFVPSEADVDKKSCFQSFSPELMLHIASFLDTTDIGRLCLVDRRLNRLYTPQLYRKIKVHFDGQYGDNLFRVANALQAHDRLGSFVHEVNIEFGHDQSPELDQRESGVMICCILKLVPNLRVLRLHCTVLPPDLWDHIPPKFLYHLDMAYSAIPNPIGLQLPLFPALTEIFLRDALVLDNDLFQNLIANCPNLRALGMNGCRRLDTKAFATLLDKCPKLEAVAFGYQQEKLDVNAALDLITEKMNSVTAVFIDGNDQTHATKIMRFLERRGSRLKSLSFNFCDINQEVVDYITRYCQNITALGINGSRSTFENHHVWQIRERCKSLKIFTLMENEGITSLCLLRLYNSKPKFDADDIVDFTREISFERSLFRDEEYQYDLSP